MRTEQEKKEKKKIPIGIYSKLFPTPEQKQDIQKVARIATFAENNCWMEWRRHDPVTSIQLLTSRRIKDETGDWPKLPTYNLYYENPGPTPYSVTAELCPELSSRIIGGIDNHVRKLYPKNRLSYLLFKERLPLSNKPHIRVSKSGVFIRRNPQNLRYYQIGVTLWSQKEAKKQQKDNIYWIDMRTCGVSQWTLKWLEEQADKGEPVCNAIITQKKKNHKKYWQVCLARYRYPDEIEQVDPIKDRTLLIWAPLNQKVFLRMKVDGVHNYWGDSIESNDIIKSKLVHQRRLEHLGRNYRQSTESGAHGHGRERALRAKIESKYPLRVKNWIEKRSTAIMEFAIKAKCEKIIFEDLTKRDPCSLRLGSFDYSGLLTRTKQKTEAANIKFQRTISLDEIKSRLSTDDNEDYESSVTVIGDVNAGRRNDSNPP